MGQEKKHTHINVFEDPINSSSEIGLENHKHLKFLVHPPQFRNRATIGLNRNLGERW